MTNISYVYLLLDLLNFNTLPSLLFLIHFSFFLLYVCVCVSASLGEIFQNHLRENRTVHMGSLYF